jgi:hypothetical protein
MLGQYHIYKYWSNFNKVHEILILLYNWVKVIEWWNQEYGGSQNVMW